MMTVIRKHLSFRRAWEYILLQVALELDFLSLLGLKIHTPHNAFWKPLFSSAQNITFIYFSPLPFTKQNNALFPLWHVFPISPFCRDIKNGRSATRYLRSTPSNPGSFHSRPRLRRGAWSRECQLRRRSHISGLDDTHTILCLYSSRFVEFASKKREKAAGYPGEDWSCAIEVCPLVLPLEVGLKCNCTFHIRKRLRVASDVIAEGILQSMFFFQNI